MRSHLNHLPILVMILLHPDFCLCRTIRRMKILLPLLQIQIITLILTLKRLRIALFCRNRRSAGPLLLLLLAMIAMTDEEVTPPPSPSLLLLLPLTSSSRSRSRRVPVFPVCLRPCPALASAAGKKTYHEY